MRKLLPILIVALVLSAACIVVAETAAPVKDSTNTIAPAIHKRITRMALTGKVMDITDSTIRIERTVKGNTEMMELDLEKPEQNIKSGDKVRVHYVEKDGKHVVTRITRVIKQSKTPIVRGVSGQNSAVPAGK
jgi:hypothetical protein